MDRACRASSLVGTRTSPLTACSTAKPVCKSTNDRLQPASQRPQGHLTQPRGLPLHHPGCALTSPSLTSAQPRTERRVEQRAPPPAPPVRGHGSAATRGCTDCSGSARGCGSRSERGRVRPLQPENTGQRSRRGRGARSRARARSTHTAPRGGLRGPRSPPSLPPVAPGAPRPHRPPSAGAAAAAQEWRRRPSSPSRCAPGPAGPSPPGPAGWPSPGSAWVATSPGRRRPRRHDARLRRRPAPRLVGPAARPSRYLQQPWVEAHVLEAHRLWVRHATALRGRCVRMAGRGRRRAAQPPISVPGAAPRKCCRPASGVRAGICGCSGSRGPGSVCACRAQRLPAAPSPAWPSELRRLCPSCSARRTVQTPGTDRPTDPTPGAQPETPAPRSLTASVQPPPPPP